MKNLRAKINEVLNPIDEAWAQTNPPSSIRRSVTQQNAKERDKNLRYLEPNQDGSDLSFSANCK